jgi:hypothetical protein
MDVAERTSATRRIGVAATKSRAFAWLATRVRLVLESVFFAVLPAAAPFVIVEYLLGIYRQHPITVDGTYFPDGGFLFDLHTMWQAGHDVVLGHSPYPFVYPAPAAFFMAPFGALPFKVAVVVFSLVLLGAAVLTLRLLGVSDWRCYGAALGSFAGTAAVTTGSLSWLIALSAALAWRYRDRRLVVASAIVFAVVTKIFLWPLVFWVIATRRFRTAVSSIVAGIVTVFGSWAMLGFDGLRDYPHRLGHIAGLETARSYSPFALVQSLGGSEQQARIVVAGLTIVVLAAIFFLARGRDGDRRAFVAALAGGLILSPIVWAHYLVLLFVVIALYRRRLAVAWLVPFAMWALPGQDSHGSAAAILLAYAIAVAAAGLAMCRPPARPQAALSSG